MAKMREIVPKPKKIKKIRDFAKVSKRKVKIAPEGD